VINHFINIACAIFLLSLVSHDANGQEKKTRFFPNSTFHSQDSSSFDDKIQKEVEKYLGVKYRKGGSSRLGVDCSGLVRLIYKNIFEVDLPYIASYQCSLSIFKNVSVEQLKTGDLIFFSSTVKKKRINHVGIYLSEGRFAHAIRRKGVIITSLGNQHWKSRIISTKRIAIREVVAFNY